MMMNGRKLTRPLAKQQRGFDRKTRCLCPLAKNISGAADPPQELMRYRV